jgi:hypothetical protein
MDVSTFYLTSPATAPEKNLMSTHASILVDSVGPPSAEVCRTAANFPYVDHPRFIELREEEVKAIPLKQPGNYDTRSICVPNTPNTLATCIGALVR